MIGCSIFVSSWAAAQVPVGKGVGALSKATVRAAQVQRQAVQQIFKGGAGGGVAQAAALHKRNYESPLLPFLKEEWEIATPEVSVPAPEKLPRAYAGRPLESLRQECAVRGILPRNWESYSRQELANFLFHYNALTASVQVPSLLETRIDAPAKKPTEADVKTWAHAQPDFIASNYLDNEYTEPFTGPVTPLHILAVNDEWEYITSLRAAAWQDGNIRLDYADSVQSAMEKLKNQPGGYDIILVDHDMEGGNGTLLSMWMYEQEIRTPAVLYSLEYMAPEWLYKYNIKGRIDIMENPQAVLNFARHIVTTGKAYPNK